MLILAGRKKIFDLSFQFRSIKDRIDYLLLNKISIYMSSKNIRGNIIFFSKSIGLKVSNDSLCFRGNSYVLCANL